MKTFYADMDKAGVPRKTDEGKLDFHALGRTSLASNLANSGAPLTLAQKIMRHSDPRLTANVYTRHLQSVSPWNLNVGRPYQPPLTCTGIHFLAFSCPISGRLRNSTK